MNHLAVYNKHSYGDDYIALMLDGKKTIDSKFTYRKTAPYKQLSIGDVIYFKESSGPIRGRVTVTEVTNQELQGPDQVMDFLAPHYIKLGIKNDAHLLKVWQMHAEKRYVCQWHMSRPEYISHPVSILKRDRRIWVADYIVPDEVRAAFLEPGR